MENIETVHQKADDTLPGFAAFLGIKLIEASREQAHMSLEIKPEYKNPYGIPHGGILATMLDHAAGIAVYCYSQSRRFVTRSADIHYLKASTDAHLEAYAHVVQSGRNMALASAEIRDSSNTLIAIGSFEFHFI